jgi:excisionase family DNA binding protein
MKAYLTAAELAKLLKVDRTTITKRIKRGEVSGAQKHGATWRIPFSVCEQLLRVKYEGR